MKHINNIILIVLLTLFYNFSWSQSIQELAKEYAGYPLIKTKNSSNYEISSQNGKLKVINKSEEEYTIISAFGIHNNKLSVNYSDLVPLLSSQAYTQLGPENENKKLTITEFQERDREDGSVFHDDLKNRVYTYSHLEIGSKKVLNTVKEFKDPNLLQKHIFIEGVPSLSNTLTITADKNIKIGYKVFNDDDHEITFKKKESINSITYEWVLNNAKPYKSESNSLGLLYSVPHIIFYIKEYDSAGTVKKMMGNVDLLSKYYNSFVTNLNIKEYPHLKQLTDQITQNDITDIDKLKSIFYWVKDNIRYVAFESGYEGFIPREAGKVYERKFGDCKDMTSIITAMAEYAEIPNVYLAWIGTIDLPYNYDEIATPSVDNHMVAAYNNNGKYIYLDATNKETPFGLPTSFIQTKQALIKTDNGFEIHRVPIVAATKNSIINTINIELTDNKVNGEGQIQLLGLSRDKIVNELNYKNSNARFNFIKSLTALGNNKYMLENFEEKNIELRDSPFIVNYTFHIPDYAKGFDGETYIKLILEEPYNNNIIDEKRLTPYNFTILSNVESIVNLKIPNTKKVTYLPSSSQFENEVAKYIINYTKNDERVTAKLQVINKKLILDNSSDYAAWNDFVKRLTKNYKETIILKDK